MRAGSWIAGEGRGRLVSGRFGSGRALLFLLVALLCCWSVPARAAVEISFHSKDFGASLPHAFIALSGTLDSTGETVEDNYGFTVRNLIGPSILFGSVQGVVVTKDAEYVAGANHHFTMVVTDDQYRAVMALVETWRNLPQPSYSIERRNCVSFVAEVATLLGLQADPRGLMRRPKAFLDRVRDQNLALIDAASPPTPAPTAVEPAVSQP